MSISGLCYGSGQNRDKKTEKGGKCKEEKEEEKDEKGSERTQRIRKRKEFKKRPALLYHVHLHLVCFLVKTQLVTRGFACPLCLLVRDFFV